MDASRHRSDLLGLIIICLTYSTFAYGDEQDTETESLQELFLGELVFPQEQKEVQLTTGVNWTKTNSGTYFVTPLAVEYGFTDKFQAGFTLPIQYGGSLGQSGIRNIELELLYNFYQKEGWLFSAALETKIPRLADNVGNEGFVFEPTLIGYKDFEHLAVNLAIGVGIPTDTSNDVEIESNLGIIVPFDWINPTLELGAEFEGDETALSIAGGTTFNLSEELQLGMALARGITDDAPEWRGFSHLVWEFDL